MAKGLRKKVQRKLASVHNNLEDAGVHLAWLIEVHKDPHPELAEALENVGVAIAGAMIMIEEFWKTTQGDLPNDWRSAARA